VLYIDPEIPVKKPTNNQIDDFWNIAPIEEQRQVADVAKWTNKL